MTHRIYFDNSATTPVRKEVVDEIMPFLTELGGNPSSRHYEGRVVRTAVEAARAKVAAAINADPSEIYFNSCASEGNNTVLRGYMMGLGKNATKNHIITTAVEHPSIFNTAAALEKEGFEVTYLPVDEKGNLNLDDLRKAIKENTGLISTMFVNNEIGNIYPVEEIGKIAHEHNILFHVDAVQAVGKIHVDVKKIGCDFLTVSAHKFYGLKGVGALFVKRGRVLKNLLAGGHQEKGKRPGTENVVGIIGMGKAIELAVAELDDEAKRVAALRDRLEKRVLEEIPYTRVVGDPSHRVPTLSNISFRFVEGEGILLKLDTEGIAVSTGSACSSSDLKASHVITAMHGDPEEAHSSIRFSLGKYSTVEDVDYTVETLKNTISLLRSFSPIYDEFVNKNKH